MHHIVGPTPWFIAAAYLQKPTCLNTTTQCLGLSKKADVQVCPATGLVLVDNYSGPNYELVDYVPAILLHTAKQPGHKQAHPCLGSCFCLICSCQIYGTAQASNPTPLSVFCIHASVMSDRLLHLQAG